ncbi:MAG TPA: CGNR zinc finger domain-containing protein [Acidimicrobiia bacterium]|nr:CGNR zinc finger domain-containing protein [Acidimicrobiia bacterium]
MDDYSGLSLAVDLANSFEVFDGLEHLRTVSDLAAFAVDHDVDPGKATATDLDRVRAARRSLRDAMLAGDEHVAVDALNALLAGSHPLPRMTHGPDGVWALGFADPSASLADRMVAEAAGGALQEIAQHGLRRFSECGSSTCEDVFVDRSRNRSRRYCTSNVCGNREAQRAFRARQAEEAGDAEAPSG